MKSKTCIIIFIIGFILTSIQALAQTLDKETKFVGANGGFYQQPTKTSDTNLQIEKSKNQLSINAGIGFFQNRSLSIGFRFNYFSSVLDSSANSLHSLNSSKIKESNLFWGISSFARYHKKIYKRLFAFVDANVSVGNHTRNLQGEQINGVGTKLINDSYKGSFGNSIYVFVRPGILYLVHSKIGIELSYGNWNLQYTNYQPSNGSGNRNIAKTISGVDVHWASLNLGVNYYFRSKPKPEPKPEPKTEAADNTTTEATK